MTVRQAVGNADRRLRIAGCESPRNDAEVLLCDLMGWRKHQLYMSLDSEMAPESLEEYAGLISRRETREPLQHLTGRVEFMDHSLAVGPGALVPRPETEVLVELVLESIRILPKHTTTILDMGTGAGPIAISLAHALHDSRIFATDPSIPALRVAAANLESCRCPGRVHLIACSLLDGIGGRFDAIVANLPYVPSGEIDGLEPEVSRGDPRIALDGGRGGLELILRLAERAPEHIVPGGILALETGEGQSGVIAQKLSKTGAWESARTMPDLCGRERYVLARAVGEVRG